MLEPKRQIFARVVLPYAAFAALWISLSDWVLAFLISDPATITQLQTYKGLVFIGVTALLLYLLLHRQMDLRERAQREQERLRDRISAILESITDGFVALDTGWHYTYVNRRGAELLGRTPPQLIGKNIWAEFPEGVGQKFHDAYHQALATQKTVYLEDYYAPWDRWFENRIYPSPDGLNIFFQDITERKQTEAQLRRMNRLYNSLSETNQAIVRAADSATLFQQVCDIAVKFGGFRLAWVGLPDGDWFRVVAAAGPARDYVEGIKVSVRADLPEGQGPSGHTFRSGEHFISGDFSQDSATVPWHERALRFGIASSAVFPLRQAGQIIGILNIYAGEPDYFQEEEVRLLDDMALDISFALDKLEQQQALRASQQDLEAIVENLPIIVFAKDAQQLRYVRVNRACEELMGAARADMLGKNDHDFFPPAQAEFFIAKDRETLAKGETVDIPEEPIDTPRGRRLSHTRKVVVRDPEGQPRYLLGIAEDITDRRKAEDALSEKQRLLSESQQIALIGSWSWDLATQAISWSEETYRLYGVSPVNFALNPDSFLNLIHPEDRAAMLAWIDNCVAGNNPGDLVFRVVPPQGEIRVLNGRGILLRDAENRPVRMMGTAQDITERKRAEDALHERDEILRLFVEHSPAAIGMFDIEMRYVAVSRRWMTDYGLGDRHIIGRSHYEIFPEIPQRWKDIHQCCLAGATERCDEDPFLRADGHTDWVKWEICPWRKADGGVGGIIIFSELVTERKRAEAMLKERDELLTETGRLAKVGGWEFDPLTSKGTWTEEVARIHDMDLREKTSAEMGLSFYHGKHRQAIDRAIKEAIESGKPYDLELEMITAKGARKWVRTIGHPVKEGNRVVKVRGSFQDITERKQAEDAQRGNSHQLEILSRRLLAAQETERRNIARELHDEIGQLLTVIKLDLQTVLRQSKVASLAPIVKESMEAIDRAVERVRDLSLDLRPSMLDDLGLVPTLRWYVQRQARHASVDINLDVPASTPRAPSDIETACFRVAQEALTNAVRHAAATKIDVTLTVQDDAIELTVRDNGKGFDVPVAHRHTMAGTGFGLLGMAERAQLAGGQLKLDSRPGAGTTMHARFPLTPPQEPAG